MKLWIYGRKIDDDDDDDDDDSHFFNFANAPTKGIKWGTGSCMYRLQESL